MHNEKNKFYTIIIVMILIGSLVRVDVVHDQQSKRHKRTVFVCVCDVFWATDWAGMALMLAVPYI